MLKLRAWNSVTKRWRWVNAVDPGPVLRGPFSFSFDTPGLADGIECYTPTIGDFLLDAWFMVNNPVFNGTTPKCDVGASNGWGLFDGTRGAVDLTRWSAPGGEPASMLPGLTSITIGQDLIASLLRPGDSYNSYNCGIIGKFTEDDPLLVWASQNGSKGGTPLDSTVGSAELYLLTATPLAFA